MNLRVVAIVGLAVFTMSSCCSQETVDPREGFRQHLEQMAKEAPNPCETPGLNDYGSVERSVFRDAAQVVTDALNASDGAAATPFAKARTALKQLEQQSGAINAGWPEENRFHSEVLDLPPVLVVKLNFRNHQNFSVFAPPHAAAVQPGKPWQEMGSYPPASDDPFIQSSLTILPLHRGPSGDPRFLASFTLMGCAGNSFDVLYDVRGWNPSGSVDQVLEQKGVFGLDQAPAVPTRKNPFPSIGELHAGDTVLTLPYCWFSAVDWWDNPSLCALDTYDISGDGVTFLSRAYNRPDLVPIAKAAEYADLHDYPAVRAYCGSDELARRLVRDGVPHAEAGLTVKRVSDEEEIVDMNSARVGVEKRNGRWVVVSVKRLE